MISRWVVQRYQKYSGWGATRLGRFYKWKWLWQSGCHQPDQSSGGAPYAVWRRLLSVFLGGLLLWSLWGLLDSQTSLVPKISGHGVAVAQDAGSLEDLKQQQQQIENQRSTLAEERDRIKRLEKASEQNLSRLREAIQTTTQQIEDYGAQLEQAKTQLAQLEQSLQVAEQTYRDRQAATVARLQFLQQQKGGHGLAILLQSRDLNEFMDQRHRLKLVYKADRTILSGLKAKADDLSRQRLQVETQRNQIALLNQQMLAQRDQFQAQAEMQKNLVSRLQADRLALEAALAQLSTDSDNLALLIQSRIAREAAAGYGIVGTGQLIVPADGPVTSLFGWRFHPILGYERFHAGIDFGAEYGSLIRAADSGQVIFAGWYGGYGYAVILDHGNGLTTLYSHASDLYVLEGEAVQQGQGIAAVGSTGLSTGPHLHFEVRQNGEPVDPLAFL